AGLWRDDRVRAGDRYSRTSHGTVDRSADSAQDRRKSLHSPARKEEATGDGPAWPLANVDVE
ncbi:hypothetical protein RFM67_34800, partial [Mesorhizobium sp. VK2D]|nr:hypothetical protein [Mesorhizobium sp. VK2D]